MAAPSQKKSWVLQQRSKFWTLPAFSPLEIRQFANSFHGNTSPPPPLQPQWTRYMWVQKLHGAKKAHGGHNSLARTIKTRRTSAKSEAKCCFFFFFKQGWGFRDTWEWVQGQLLSVPRTPGEQPSWCHLDGGNAAKRAGNSSPLLSHWRNGSLF